MVAAAKNRKLRSTDTGAAKYLAEAQIAFLLAKKVIVSAKYLDLPMPFFSVRPQRLVSQQVVSSDPGDIFATHQKQVRLLTVLCKL